ncbi:uncharacterized protein [Paramisgurnus dabryanus]|uniref:uncharacterized protein n=1 Tax=Paramisgurnus dabryanus TaxID=90735 RepID=UPI0031F3F5D4
MSSKMYTFVKVLLNLLYFSGLVLLCQRGVKAVDLTACEGETAQLTCDLTSQVIACDSDTASLHCDQGGIKVISANYGRTSSATCSSGKPANQISNIQCTQSSSLSVLASRCDGQKDCSIPANSTVFGDPCGGTYKYLNVSYICIPPSAIIETRTVCEAGTITICCNHWFIKMLSANYGRTNSETCSTGRPANQTSNVQCIRSSTLSVLAAQCDGTHACPISASHKIFGDPCGGTYKYLNVSYICHPNNQFIKVSAANYGRTNGVTCSTGKPADQISNVQCTQSSTLSVLTTQCDGQTNCSVLANSTVFGDPCAETYKYLNVSYTCGPGNSLLPGLVEVDKTDIIIILPASNSQSSCQLIYSRTKPDLVKLSYFILFSIINFWTVNMQQGRMSLIFWLVLLCQCGVKAVDLTACEGETAQLTCDLTSQVIACDSDTASLHCDQGRIKVISANYGRTSSATCSSGKPANQISNVQCTQSSSLSVLASRCDGRKDCSIPANSTVFGDPCGGTCKYLNVSYICIPSSAIIQKRTVCEAGTINISCNNRFIKMLSANYGRTNRVTCSSGIPGQTSNVQCIQNSTLSVLANRCDGTHACPISASHSIFGDPCGGTYKYLNVSYICHPNNQFIKVSAANYGRTNSTTCSTGKPADQISNVQCSQSSSLSVLTTQCNGQNDCSVLANSTVFGDPCAETYKYLNVSYTCGPDPATQK